MSFLAGATRPSGAGIAPFPRGRAGGVSSRPVPGFEARTFPCLKAAAIVPVALGLVHAGAFVAAELVPALAAAAGLAVPVTGLIPVLLTIVSLLAFGVGVVAYGVWDRWSRSDDHGSLAQGIRMLGQKGRLGGRSRVAPIGFGGVRTVVGGRCGNFAHKSRKRRDLDEGEKSQGDSTVRETRCEVGVPKGRGAQQGAPSTAKKVDGDCGGLARRENFLRIRPFLLQQTLQNVMRQKMNFDESESSESDFEDSEWA